MVKKMNAMKWNNLALGLIISSGLCGMAMAAKDTKEKEDPRPKRGSLDIGKGHPAQTDESKIDQFNSFFTKVVDHVSPAVVSVNTEKKYSERDQQLNNPLYEFFGIPQQPQQAPESNGPKRNIPLGGGSGFIVSKQGYVFTNAHVVEGADIVKVSLLNKKTYTAKVVGVDKKADVAVLKITAKPEELTVADFGDSKKLTIGEWVLAIGNPFALQNTVTAGIVSAKGRRDQISSADSYQDFIQTDAAVNPGNSGGPLVNLKGEVVGINSSIYTRTGGYMGVSFAIPINMAVKVAEDLIYEGKVTRGYLGIGIDNVSENLAEAMGLTGTQGCLVKDVMKNSPAAKGGLKEADIILKVEGTAVQDAADLRNMVADLKPNQKYNFDILREGKKISLDLKVGAKPDEAGGNDENSEPNDNQEEGNFFSKKLGLNFGILDKELRTKYNISNEAKGVVITSVSNGSGAAEAGLTEGIVLQAYKRQSDDGFVNIEDALKFMAMLKTLKSNEKIAFKVLFKGRIDFVALKSEE